jgi:hypothetical protein
MPKMFGRLLEEKNIRPMILIFSSIRGMRVCLKRGIGLTLCPQIYMGFKEDIDRILSSLALSYAPK